MIAIKNDNFSVPQICESGQCFRMTRCGEEGRYSLVAFGKYLELQQEGNTVFFDCTQEEYDNIWRTYFDMDTDYAEIIGSIDSVDGYLLSAADFGKGIRILRQDLWEMMISFIISQQNNIKRIRRCIRLLCEKYGEPRHTKNGTVYYAFPTPQALAGAAIEDLYDCNLGYRSRYVRQTADSVLHREIDMEALYRMDYGEAREQLLKLYGVGGKVADCICLFALHKTEAFPVDTHIRKALAAQYPDGFPFEKYADYGGILQQYIFYYDLRKNMASLN